MNMIDMYLSMNSCSRDDKNNLYLIKDEGKKTLIGKIQEINMDNGELNMKISTKYNLKFVTFNIEVENELE